MLNRQKSPLFPLLTSFSGSIRLPYALLSFFIFLHAALTLAASLTLRHEFKTAAQDGATFAQLLFNVIHGNGLVTTIFPPGIAQPWLGIHFSPVLYALTPIYYLFPHIETLLVIHSVFIALAAWPIFLTAEYLLHSRWQALLVSLLYLVNPFVVNGAVWDFHEIAFAPLIMGFIVWSIVCKKRTHLLVFCALLLTIKEHYGLAVFGSGLLWAWHWRDVRFGAALAAFGLAALALILLVIMPHYHLDNHLVWTNSNQAGWVQRFSWLNHPFGPDSLLPDIMSRGFFYIVHLVLALWFLPLMELIWWLPGLADIAINGLANGDIMKSEFSYHSAALMPVIIIAAIVYIAKRFSPKNNLKPVDVLIAMMLTSCFGSYMFTIDTNIWEISPPRLTLLAEDQKALDGLNRLIPKNASVAAQFNALPQIDTRKEMYQFPQHPGDATYIVLYAYYPFDNAIGVFDSPYGDGGAKQYFFAVRALFTSPNWHVIYFSNGWTLFQKGGAEKLDAQQKALQVFKDTEETYDTLLCLFKPKKH